MKSIKNLFALAGAILLLSPTIFAEESGDDLLGGDLSQWSDVSGRPVPEGWEIVEGVLHRTGKTPSDIVTKKKYKNFEFSFDWKIEKGGNSGVKYRTRGSLGLEYQIMDDGGGGNPLHRAGGLYELAAPADARKLNPPGEWNTSKIVADGNKIEHWLNGVKVVEIEYGSEDWKKRFGASKYKDSEGFGDWEGPILLQGYLAFPAQFRNLRVKEL